MNMNKETYERLMMDVTKFDVEDVITTSGVGPAPGPGGNDRLDTYELVYAIEEELGVSIPDEKANEFETVRDAYDFIKANK